MAKSKEGGVLELRLHDTTIGHLVALESGRRVLTFSPEFVEDNTRPTFSLVTSPGFPNAVKLLAEPWVSGYHLHPVLANLLPEGALRIYFASQLGISSEYEFDLLAHLGPNLPGALKVTLLQSNIVPDYVAVGRVPLNVPKRNSSGQGQRFSLAGMQLKLPLREAGGHYLFGGSTAGKREWIIKLPSSRYRGMPLNEYSAMFLAALAGIETPDIRLVRIDTLENLPDLAFPPEQYAFAIRRFDRAGNNRIHTEDFAQVLVRHPLDDKCTANYQRIGKIIYRYTGDCLGNAQQFARRLLVKILLGNGDAHLKNWSLIYPDTRTPELSPAYDILSTQVYAEEKVKSPGVESKVKAWYRVNMQHFQTWAGKADVPWRAIKPQLNDTMERARSLWPSALEELPMEAEHKDRLRQHWRQLAADFQIKCSP